MNIRHKLHFLLKIMTTKYMILTSQMLLRYLRCPIVLSFTVRLLRHFRVSKPKAATGILHLSNNPGLAFTHFTSTRGGSSGTCSWSILLKEVKY
jgi:hypothetical protein